MNFDHHLVVVARSPLALLCAFALGVLSVEHRQIRVLICATLIAVVVVDILAGAT